MATVARAVGAVTGAAATLIAPFAPPVAGALAGVSALTGFAGQVFAKPPAAVGGVREVQIHDTR